jgi:hypothetical protein
MYSFLYIIVANKRFTLHKKTLVKISEAPDTLTSVYI